MSWVNLDDVYVNKTGGTISGDLDITGALTVNSGNGDDTTYNVANEITTLRDSVSPKIIASTIETSWQSFNVDLSGARMCCVICYAIDGNRPLASTTNIVSDTMSDMCAIFPIEPNNYEVIANYSNKTLRLKTKSIYDKAVFITYQHSVSPTILYTDEQWHVYIYGQLIFVHSQGVTTGSGSWDSTKCPYTMPQKYRPSINVQTLIITNNGGSHTGALQVKTDGTIEVYNAGNSGSTDARFGILVYPII